MAPASVGDDDRAIRWRMTSESEVVVQCNVDELYYGSFKAVADVMADRAAHALAMLPGAPLVVAGGVAANTLLRATLTRVAEQHGVKFESFTATAIEAGPEWSYFC